MNTKSGVLARDKLFVFASLSLLTLVSGDVRANGPGGRMEERRFEIRYMSQMADHHMGALQMGQLCKTKATHDELKALCDKMIQAQTEEIAKLKGWLKEWYVIDYQPMVMPAAAQEKQRTRSAFWR